MEFFVLLYIAYAVLQGIHVVNHENIASDDEAFFKLRRYVIGAPILTAVLIYRALRRKYERT